jgi:hypothetical protein
MTGKGSRLVNIAGQGLMPKLHVKVTAPARIGRVASVSIPLR